MPPVSGTSSANFRYELGSPILLPVGAFFSLSIFTIFRLKILLFRDLLDVAVCLVLHLFPPSRFNFLTPPALLGTSTPVLHFNSFNFLVLICS